MLEKAKKQRLGDFFRQAGHVFERRLYSSESSRNGDARQNFYIAANYRFKVYPEQFGPFAHILLENLAKERNQMVQAAMLDLFLARLDHLQGPLLTPQGEPPTPLGIPAFRNSDVAKIGAKTIDGINKYHYLRLRHLLEEAWRNGSELEWPLMKAALRLMEIDNGAQRGVWIFSFVLFGRILQRVMNTTDSVNYRYLLLTTNALNRAVAVSPHLVSRKFVRFNIDILNLKPRNLPQGAHGWPGTDRIVIPPHIASQRKAIEAYNLNLTSLQTNAIAGLEAVIDHIRSGEEMHSNPTDFFGKENVVALQKSFRETAAGRPIKPAITKVLSTINLLLAGPKVLTRGGFEVPATWLQPYPKLTIT
jgi:hypothetical protein